jgi:hypothetical protein
VTDTQVHAAALAGTGQRAGHSMPPAPPCRAANAGSAMAGHVPGQGAPTAPHLAAPVRPEATFVNGILAERPDEDAPPAAT